MAIKLYERYPGRANPASVDYPQGSFKNRTSPDAKDGTYLEQDWANDDQGFKQSLLSAAGISANGTVDVVGSSQYFDALKQVISDESPKSTQPLFGPSAKFRASATGSNSFVSVYDEQIILEDSIGNTQKVVGVNISIDTSATGLNGLDAGSLAANTWYSVWVISDGLNVRGIISLSATTPALPVGYTHKALVGWVITDGSANKFPRKFQKNGQDVDMDTLVASGIAGNPTTPVYVEVSLAMSVSPSATRVRVNAYTGTATRLIVAPNSSYGGDAIATTNPPTISLNTSNDTGTTTGFSDIGLETRSLFWAANHATYAKLIVRGWKELV